MSFPVLPLERRVSIRLRDIITKKSVDESVVLMLNLVWGSKCYQPHECTSGSDCFQGLILDGLVHEPTDRLTAFDHIGQRSYESSNIVDGVIVVTTTSESDGSGVIFESNVLDSGAVGDSELHDESVNQSVCFLPH